MMRTTTTLRLGLLLAVAMLAAGPAAAQGQNNDWQGHRGDSDHPRMEQFSERRLERATVFLDLNDQQVAQWRDLMADRGATRDDAREEIQVLHQEIRDFASASKPDARAIGELVIEAHRLMEAGRAEREALHAELMSILTPEQQERFAALEELRPERGPRGRHGGRQGGRGLRHGGPDRGDR